MVKIIAPLTQVDSTTALYNVGSRTMTNDGNEYIYLPGADSVVLRDWVSIQTISGLSYGSVTRLTTSGKGLVGIAQGAIISNTYGWFGTYGVFYGKCGNTVASGTALYASGTTAAVDTVVTAGALLEGVISVTTGTGASTGTVGVFINHPFVGASGV